MCNIMCNNKSCLGTGHYLWPGGPRRKTTFYKKVFRDPLGARTKNSAAHSTSRDNFSTPTLKEYSTSIFIGKILANFTSLMVVCKVLKTAKECLGSGENFQGRNISMPTLAFSIFFPSPLSVHQKFFVAPPLFPPAPPAINNDRFLNMHVFSYQDQVSSECCMDPPV